MQTIHTDNAPAAIGPYCQAIKVGGMLFTSGQIPLRADGTMVEGDITVQTQQVLANLKAILLEAGVDFANVIKTTVFLKNLDDFVAMNTIYAQAFGPHKPARSTVQVAKLPKDALIEVEVIASLA
ncbi:MAG TPA: deaminase [Methylophilaceae bacterium]|nr:deaminase [Methylophilaceae bacterium]